MCSKSNKIPIGLVISSLNWWRGEHTGLTLGAQLGPLLGQLLPKKWSITQVLFSNKNSIMSKFYSYLHLRIIVDFFFQILSINLLFKYFVEMDGGPQC